MVVVVVVGGLWDVGGRGSLFSLGLSMHSRVKLNKKRGGGAVTLFEWHVLRAHLFPSNWQNKRVGGHLWL